jgi:hypothetical protein
MGGGGGGGQGPWGGEKASYLACSRFHKPPERRGVGTVGMVEMDRDVYCVVRYFWRYFKVRCCAPGASNPGARAAPGGPGDREFNSRGRGLGHVRL